MVWNGSALLKSNGKIFCWPNAFHYEVSNGVKTKNFTKNASFISYFLRVRRSSCSFIHFSNWESALQPLRRQIWRTFTKCLFLDRDVKLEVALKLRLCWFNKHSRLLLNTYLKSYKFVQFHAKLDDASDFNAEQCKKGPGYSFCHVESQTLVLVIWLVERFACLWKRLKGYCLIFWIAEFRSWCLRCWKFSSKKDTF